MFSSSGVNFNTPDFAVQCCTFPLTSLAESLRLEFFMEFCDNFDRIRIFGFRLVFSYFFLFLGGAKTKTKEERKVTDRCDETCALHELAAPFFVVLSQINFLKISGQ